MKFKTQSTQLQTVGEMKKEAKAQLSGRWKDAVILNVIPTIVTSLLIFAIFELSSLVLSQPIDPGQGNSIFGIVINIIGAFLFIGVSYTFLDMIRFDSYKMSPLKDVFQVFSGKFFLGNLIIYILKNLYVTLWTLLFIIPGIIKSLAYSQAHFMYKDAKDQNPRSHPDGNDMITASRELMDGNKGQYFTLQLSFIGWHFLSIILLGIPYLWVYPYIETTQAVFYQNLVNESEQK